MSKIEIRKIGVTKLDVDVIVNAANSNLAEGGGVCGAIFKEAGAKELTKACRNIGGCKTGSAVITPAFKLPAKYIIHAVGPVWNGGKHSEPQLLYSCYMESLKLAMGNNCHSIGFPLISSGIFGYPMDKAWRKALQACNDFINDNPDYDIDITFAVLEDYALNEGKKELIKQQKEAEKRDSETAEKAMDLIENSKNPMVGGGRNLEKAILDFHASKDKRDDILFEALLEELKDNAEVIVPIELDDNFINKIDVDNVNEGDVITTDEEVHFTIRTLGNKDGELVYPVFTNMDEVRKGDGTSTIPDLLENMMKRAIGTEGCLGIELNPFGDELRLFVSSDAIAALLNALEPPTQDMIDLENGVEAYNNGDYKNAFFFYSKAASAGNITAISNLGYCYYYGRDMEVNKEKARECWEKAAIFGDICAIYKLGDMYRNGDLEEDLVISEMLYMRAFDLSIRYGEIYNRPDIYLRILKYCQKHFEKDALREIADDAVDLFKERIDKGDQFSHKMYNEAKEIQALLRE